MSSLLAPLTGMPVRYTAWRPRITAWRYAEGYLPGLGDDDQDNADGGGEDAAASGRTKPKNGLVLVCACARKIRASVSVAELGPIICGVCAAPFVGSL